MDRKDLQKGEDIEELLTIIKGAKLSIAVFSQRYVESKWCLQELSQMVECHRNNGQIILHIFFKVETSDVKNQSGCFEISSQGHSEEASHETLSRWKDALKAVGDMSGWVFDDRGMKWLKVSSWTSIHMTILVYMLKTLRRCPS
ncbi:disease resistance protein L6-like [Macadamia integrifolia]|uniref:disease resistance protein L6-like n=1 Tax=Macadamia integrifolia TaxID=60698 RepID=UPI001C530394|nr:disease resistance protein L6-like [Macadamia integrifolia]